MGFLRRLLGGSDERPATPDSATGDALAPSSAVPDAETSEQAYELDLLRGEQDRLDELRQRQLRYADYAWQPPAEGGTRRADDGDGERE
jgi:hypothetical protein